MSGLGKVKDSDVTFLSVAGGYIWDRKADKNHPDYAEQEYEKADKSIGTRTGARYADLTGFVEKVEFRTHAEYGESINVTFNASGELYIVSISTNNRYSQDLMKALLLGDIEKPLFMKPYDFVGSDKKRTQGISFRQDGAKLELKVEDAPTQDAEWFKTADKKKIKRFFEDLNDWYVAEVEEKVVPNCKQQPKAEKEATEEKAEEAPKQEKKAEKKVAEKKEEAPAGETVSPIAMKKALRAYVADNYEGKELPPLSGQELVKWYELAVAEEELPFVEETEEEEGSLDEAEEEDDDIEARLNSLK